VPRAVGRPGGGRVRATGLARIRESRRDERLAGSRDEGLAGSVLPRRHVAEIQRSRLLASAVRAVAELGYSQTTVSDIVARSGVSRRTFYQMFANREECLLAVLEDAIGQVGVELERAGLEGLEWRERLRTGLWRILAFLDREPVLAHVCVVGALSGGPAVLERREEVLAGLAGVVDEGRLEAGGRARECTALTAEGLVGAAMAIVYARLLKGRREPLTGLLGELMGMIVLPYLGPAAARRELARPAPRKSVAQARPPAGSVTEQTDPLEGVPMRLTYRTARVLEGAQEHPGASNREVGDLAGIPDPGQVSKLLRRLERLGLLANSGSGVHYKGEAYAWSLTPKGEQVARSIRMHTPRREAA
jgi:AcrR family transcriptional regulator/DNA-binding MarR family transcriptional regulator